MFRDAECAKKAEGRTKKKNLIIWLGEEVILEEGRRFWWTTVATGGCRVSMFVCVIAFIAVFVIVAALGWGCGDTRTWEAVTFSFLQFSPVCPN